MVRERGKQSEIKVPFPKDKIKRYLKSFGIKSLRKAEKSQLSALFIKIIEDFKKGELCLDEFSSISNYLWWEGGVMSGKEKSDKEFYNLLEQAGELSFYVRAGSKEARVLLLGPLNSIFDYYERFSKN